MNNSERKIRMSDIPCFFSAFMDKCIRNATDVVRSMLTENAIVHVLLYANDAMLLAQSLNNLQWMSDLVDKENGYEKLFL